MTGHIFRYALFAGLALGLAAAADRQEVATYVNGNILGLEPNTTVTLTYSGAKSVLVQARDVVFSVPYTALNHAELKPVSQDPSQSALFGTFALEKKPAKVSDRQLLVMDFDNEASTGKVMVLEMEKPAAQALYAALQDAPNAPSADSEIAALVRNSANVSFESLVLPGFRIRTPEGNTQIVQPENPAPIPAAAPEADSVPVVPGTLEDLAVLDLPVLALDILPPAEILAPPYYPVLAYNPPDTPTQTGEVTKRGRSLNPLKFATRATKLVPKTKKEPVAAQPPAERHDTFDQELPKRAMLEQQAKPDNKSKPDRQADNATQETDNTAVAKKNTDEDWWGDRYWKTTRNAGKWNR